MLAQEHPFGKGGAEDEEEGCSIFTLSLKAAAVVVVVGRHPSFTSCLKPKWLEVAGQQMTGSVESLKGRSTTKCNGAPKFSVVLR